MPTNNDDKEGIMPTVEAADDIELLAIRFARLQAEHDQRSEDDAKQRSRDAIRSWGECVPAALKEIDVHAGSDSRRPRCQPTSAGVLNFNQEVTHARDP